MGIRPPTLLPGKRFPQMLMSGIPTNVVIGDPGAGSMQLVLFERGHWCSSCRRHLAQIDTASGEFRKRKVQAVAVTHESLEDLAMATLQTNYRYPIGADPLLDISGPLGLTGPDEFGKHTIRPAAVIVCPGGEIAFSYVGDDSLDRLSVPALLLAIDRIT